MKTCPWCQHPGLLVSRTRRVGFFLHPRHIQEYRVRCSNVACGYGPAGDWQPSIKTALEEWDYRPEKDEPTQTVRYPEAGTIKGAETSWIEGKVPAANICSIRQSPPYAPCGEEKTKFLKYLDSLEITSENIGSIRARLLAPFDCEWNAFIRDETAAREVNTIRPPANETTTAESVSEAELATLSRSRDELAKQVGRLAAQLEEMTEDRDQWRKSADNFSKHLKAANEQRDRWEAQAKQWESAAGEYKRQALKLAEQLDAAKKRAELAENLVKKLNVSCSTAQAKAEENRQTGLKIVRQLQEMTAERDNWKELADRWYKRWAGVETVGKTNPLPTLYQPFLTGNPVDDGQFLARAINRARRLSASVEHAWSDLSAAGHARNLSLILEGILQILPELDTTPRHPAGHSASVDRNPPLEHSSAEGKSENAQVSIDQANTAAPPA